MATNKFWGRLVAAEPGIDPNGPKVGGTRSAAGLRLDHDPDVPTAPTGAATSTPTHAYGGKSESAAPAAPNGSGQVCIACRTGTVDADGTCSDATCPGF